jgi:hypothetical protein
MYLHAITFHYMHYMPLYARHNANVRISYVISQCDLDSETYDVILVVWYHRLTVISWSCYTLWCCPISHVISQWCDITCDITVTHWQGPGFKFQMMRLSTINRDHIELELEILPVQLPLQLDWRQVWPGPTPAGWSEGWPRARYRPTQLRGSLTGRLGESGRSLRQGHWHCHRDCPSGILPIWTG